MKTPKATLTTEVVGHNDGMRVVTIDITGTLIDDSVPTIVWTELAIKSMAKLAGRTLTEVRERYPEPLRVARHQPAGLVKEHVKVILKTAPGAVAWEK